MNIYFAEFLGTAILVLLTSGGFGVALGDYVVGNIPDAHLNTTVNLAFAMDHSLSWSMVPEYIIAKILSVIVGAILVWLAYLWYWEATEEPGAKLCVFFIALSSPTILLIL